jgi:hypothetical protein
MVQKQVSRIKMMRMVLMAVGFVLVACTTDSSYDRRVDLGRDVIGLDERKDAALNLRRNENELNAAERGSLHDYLGIDPVE